MISLQTSNDNCHHYLNQERKLNPKYLIWYYISASGLVMKLHYECSRHKVGYYAHQHSVRQSDKKLYSIQALAIGNRSYRIMTTTPITPIMPPT